MPLKTHRTVNNDPGVALSMDKGLGFMSPRDDRQILRFTCEGLAPVLHSVPFLADGLAK